MSDHYYRSEPELSDFLETMELLGEGPSEVLPERPSEDLWQAIAADAFGSTSVPASSGDDHVALPIPIHAGTRSLNRWLLLSGGIAAAFVLLLLIPLGLAWSSSRDIPVDYVAQLDQLGDFEGQGSATLRGDSLQVDVANLPLDASSTYELWLIDLEGGEIQDLTSLGKIDSSAEFEVPEGIDPQQYSVVDVSIEPNDGNPDHSGVSVLQGELTSS